MDGWMVRTHNNNNTIIIIAKKSGQGDFKVGQDRRAS